MVKGKKAFYDDLKHPIVGYLNDHYDAIKFDLDLIRENDLQNEWLEKQIYNKGWNGFMFRFKGQDLPLGIEVCKGVSGLLKKYDELIHMAAFSILDPGTIIYPHEGYTEDVLRLHMPIEVPQGDCAIKVGGIERQWNIGDIFIFDDTVMHEAWNKTEETRVILLIDLYKEKLIKKNFLQKLFSIK